jgi:hypothetical protein
MNIGDYYFRIYNRYYTSEFQIVVYKVLTIIDEEHFTASVIFNSNKPKFSGKTKAVRLLTNYTPCNFTDWAGFKDEYPELFI